MPHGPSRAGANPGRMRHRDSQTRPVPAMSSYRNSETPPAIMTGSPPSSIVPKLDWDRPPWNRWAFHHVREIVPTQEVWRGGGHAKRLARDERDLDGLAVASSIA